MPDAIALEAPALAASRAVPRVAVSDAASPALAGDPDAFRALYAAHAPRVHALCLRLEHDAATAEELTQDVFVRAWQKLDGFRGEAAFGTWLHRLAVNLMLEARGSKARDRQRHAESEVLPELSARRTTPDEAMDLEDALRELPPGMRQVFTLHDVEGYRHEEIGELLGISSGTSKSQLHRARMALRERLMR